MRDLLTYLLFRLLSLVAHLAGRRGAVALGRLLGLAIAATDYRTGRLLRHMSRAVGRRRAKSLLKKYHEHLGLLAVEYMRLDTYDPKCVREWMEPEGLDRFREILSRGKGIILLTGHLGNWEIGGQSLVAYGLPLRVLYRPLKNPYLDRHVRRVREWHGMSVHGKRAGVHFVLRTLKAGEVSGIFLDQNGGADGVYVPFFGELASTLPTAARISRRTGAPIVPMSSHRLPDRTRHTPRIGPEIVPVNTGKGNEERDVLVTTYLCNRAIEDAILEAPAQWIWAHRRWQHPPGEAEVAAWEEAARYLNEAKTENGTPRHGDTETRRTTGP